MNLDNGQTEEDNLSTFPGGDFVAKGLSDLARHIISEEALLVLIAGPRLQALGITVPPAPETCVPYEHALFSAIELREPAGAHAAYNALIGRVVSFANAYGVQRRAET
ncbi:MAG: hypothetical protein ACYC96_08840 [Fimbriimonadaceae bacterium]